jgi:hypothetical protein
MEVWISYFSWSVVTERKTKAWKKKNGQFESDRFSPPRDRARLIYAAEQDQERSKYTSESDRQGSNLSSREGFRIRDRRHQPLELIPLTSE